MIVAKIGGSLVIRDFELEEASEAVAAL